jgi:hypothetical protein
VGLPVLRGTLGTLDCRRGQGRKTALRVRTPVRDEYQLERVEVCQDHATQLGAAAQWPAPLPCTLPSRPRSIVVVATGRHPDTSEARHTQVLEGSGESLERGVRVRYQAYEAVKV